MRYVLACMTIITMGCSGNKHLSNNSISKPDDAPVVLSAESIYANRLDDGSIITVTKQVIMIRPTKPIHWTQSETESSAAFLEPYPGTTYDVVLTTPDGQSTRLYWQLNALQAFPSSMKFLDIKLNRSKSKAVLIWNESGFAWASVVSRNDDEKRWDELPRLPRDPHKGGGSIGDHAVGASVYFDEDDQSIIVSIVRPNKAIDRFRADTDDEGRLVWIRND